MTFSIRFARTLPLFAVVLISFAVATFYDAARAQSSTHTQLAKLLAEPLPGHLKPEAASASYTSDTLDQYIDGGADVYLLYDFQMLLHQDFKTGATEITADIYDMGKVEDAFGIYSAERSPKYAYISMGAEGYRSKGVLNFFQDR